MQEHPEEGNFKRNMNLTIDELLKRLKKEQGRIVYSYVLTSVENNHNQFSQEGCPPNFEGGLITLCTCKALMRTWKNTSEWKNDAWIVGFTSLDLMGDKRNYLFYLMKVGDAFESFKEMWNAVSLISARTEKSTRVNLLGDVYEPKPDLVDKFNSSNYYETIKTHVHAEAHALDRWREDIEYIKKGKRPALLVGEVDKSYLWSRPTIYFKGKHPRTKKYDDIESFWKRLI